MVEPPDDVNVELGEASAAGFSSDSPSVLISASALLEMNLHAASEPEHEIGGIMLGQVVEGTGLVVVVEDVIRGTKMDHSSGSVTFTHETWSEINRIKDEQFPDSKVVGWYHSHPGFGIFLSGHDLFIHKNFFNQPWQIAFVTDPRAHTFGAFVWQDQGLVQEEFGVLTSPDAFKYPSLAPEKGVDTAGRATASAPAADLYAQPARGGGRDLSLMIGLGMLGMLLTMVLLVAVTNFLTIRRLHGAIDQLSGKIGVLESKLDAQLSTPAPPPQVPAQPPAGAVPGIPGQPHTLAPGVTDGQPPATAPGTGPAADSYRSGP